jgi:hypothetical protein
MAIQSLDMTPQLIVVQSDRMGAAGVDVVVLDYFSLGWIISKVVPHVLLPITPSVLQDVFPERKNP